MRKQKGITLIALVITIIVLLILAGVTIATLTGDNGLLQKAANSKQANEKGQIEEQIKLAYNEWKLQKETGETVDLQNTVQTTLDKTYDNVTISKQGKSIIINVKGYEFTLVDDGTIENGKLAYLDIADGNIDIYSNGYKQYTGNLENLNNNNITENSGKYIITGTTTENVVRVCDEGTFDITIKNLNIDVSEKSNTCAFNANRGGRQTGCYVKITLEGKNNLSGGSAPGLGFTNATPNVNGVTNGSTLTIEGNGYLVAKASVYSAAIGAGYTGFEGSAGQVSNIIINSGNITADKSAWDGHGAGIGGGLYGKVNNIVINGGNINACGSGYCPAIGASSSAENIVINGGNIKTNASWARGGIGGYSGNVKITGGSIYSAGSTFGGYEQAAIGQILNVEIEGGTIITDSPKHAGIFKNEENNVKIIGGNLQLGGVGDIGTLDSNKNFVHGISTDGTNNLYKTPIKLQDVGENKQITKLTTSDNIEYGINDMYTLENGMLYLYLPTGTRTITIEVDGKTYSGTVETKETSETATLTQIN